MLTLSFRIVELGRKTWVGVLKTVSVQGDEDLKTPSEMNELERA
jgi:hypothetical protein